MQTYQAQAGFIDDSKTWCVRLFSWERHHDDGKEAQKPDGCPSMVLCVASNIHSACLLAGSINAGLTSGLGTTWSLCADAWHTLRHKAIDQLTAEAQAMGFYDGPKPGCNKETP